MNSSASPHHSLAATASLDFTLPSELPSDPAANPFRVVVDPALRVRLRQALAELINSHDDQLAQHFASGKLSLDSYKEYIELFARCLRETMESREGVGYLLNAAGFQVPPEEINLHPQWRWKE